MMSLEGFCSTPFYSLVIVAIYDLVIEHMILLKGFCSTPFHSLVIVAIYDLVIEHMISLKGFCSTPFHSLVNSDCSLPCRTESALLLRHFLYRRLVKSFGVNI